VSVHMPGGIGKLVNPLMRSYSEKRSTFLTNCFL
jgi:hypothetical protein